MRKRVINVSQGAKEYLKVSVSESTGEPITEDDVEIGFQVYTETDITWVTPDSITRPSASSIIASVLVGETFVPTINDYYIWVKLTGEVEDIIFRINNGMLVVL